MTHLAIGFGGQAVATRAEVRGDRAVGGEEPLSVARALETPHPPLALPGRLVRILRPVVQPLAPSVLCAGEDFPRGRHIAAGLRQDIEDFAVLIDGSPEVVLLAIDGKEHLVRGSRVTRARASTAQRIGVNPAEFPAPRPDRLIDRYHAPFGQQFLGEAGFAGARC